MDQIYAGHDDVLRAIRRVQRHLDDAFITEGCADDMTLGCVSCQAVRIKDELEMLARDVEDDQARPPPPDPQTLYER
jgi:hypothetical protein